MTSVKVPSNIITTRLYTKLAKDSLLLYKEREFSFGAINCDIGFQQKKVIIKKLSTSPTTYSFIHKYNLLINSIFTFSVIPLYTIFYFGLLTTIFSMFFIIKLIVYKLYYNLSLEGWTSLIVSVWFLGGLIILFLGIIAIYLSKIFIETKNRPFSIIKQIYKE